MTRLTTEEPAQRLGVKPETVYAYVSRGLLRPRRAADGRTSTFDRGDVERLAQRGRRGRSGDDANAGTVTMVSALTLIEGGRYYYRGSDALELATTPSIDAVAAWL